MAKDIRIELAKVLGEYGHDIVYIRTDKRFRCECYVERSGEATADCPLCFGTSYVVSVSKAKTRRTISSIPETLAGARKQQGTGFVSPKAFVYYMEHFVTPKEGDYILEVEWVNGIPKKIKEKHEISAIDPKQGKKGRIEFYHVYCRFNPKGANDDDALSNY